MTIQLADGSGRPPSHPNTNNATSLSNIFTYRSSSRRTIEVTYIEASLSNLRTAAADGLPDNMDSKPTLPGHSSGWNSDGWTPPETHLLGETEANDETTTPVTEASSPSNETESFNNTTVSAATNGTEEEVTITTTTIATTITTSSTNEETTSTTTTTTTEAT
ncbi:hypothetical protein ACHAXM_001667 [Skeletonema potamos]